MIDGSEKRNRQLAFERKNSCVCEKCSNMSHRKRVRTLESFFAPNRSQSESEKNDTAFSLRIEARVNQRKMIQKKNSVLIRKKRMRIEGNQKNHQLS